MKKRTQNKPWTRASYFLPLTLFGIMHFITPKYFEHMVPKFIYGGIFWVYFSGITLTSTSLAIISNFIPKTAAVCLLVFVIIFIATVDIPEFISGKDQNRFVISFFKDVSLFSGTLFFLKNT